MINFNKLSRKPRTFNTFTGITIEEFNKLLISFQSALDIYEYETFVKDKKRIRKFGGGRKTRLVSNEDKLMFILIYFKLYPLQEVQGMFFDMSQGRANEWIQRLTKILNKTLGYEKQLPIRKGADLESLLLLYPELNFLLDGTERPIQRPKTKEFQQDYYSGKKKRHTIKNNILTSVKTGKILYLSKTVNGKVHDKRLADEDPPRLLKGSTIGADTGYIGLKIRGTKILMPKKKPKGIDLTETEKELNRALSRVRVGVEHSIRGIKISRICKDTFRNWVVNYEDEVMEVGCGLHNFRVSSRQR